MTTLTISSREISRQALDHMLGRIAATPAVDEPFSHLYVEEILPCDLYERLLQEWPDPGLYRPSDERPHDDEEGDSSMFPLVRETLGRLPEETAALWRGVALALSARELKKGIYAKLSKDLAYRYGIDEDKVTNLPGYARPTLVRETEGSEVPAHPGSRKQVVSMHLGFAADRSRNDAGMAFYRRRRIASPFGKWQDRFAKVKQFPFPPNSGYAFVVNNTLTKKSWYGREKLPRGAGVRNTLSNTFYEQPRDE